jgi:hypothetical protein
MAETNGVLQKVLAVAGAAALVCGAVITIGYQAQQLSQLRIDYDKLERRVDGLDVRSHETNSSLAANGVALKEIETQFCASDMVRNLMHANDLRQVSLLWEKEFGTPYPTNNAYYPMICKSHDGG